MSQLNCSWGIVPGATYLTLRSGRGQYRKLKRSRYIHGVAVSVNPRLTPFRFTLDR